MFIGALLFVASAAPAAENPALPAPTPKERDDYIRRARVWEPTDVASKDLFNGPQGELNFAVDQEIACDFVPKPMAGWTEKFLCRLDDGRIFKVKYIENDKYKEAVSEVLGTRLFWALGFHADKMLPVRVTCRGCPKDPWKYVNVKRKLPLDEKGFFRSLPPEAEAGTYMFDPAAMEERLDVVPIESRKDEGWSWRSLDKVDESLGGSTKAETDALKLLDAFVQNADNKAQQNALACPRRELVEDEAGRATCRHPIMYVDDLGSVFGKGGFVTGYAGRADYEAWKKRHVWASRKSCKARLVSIGWRFRRSTLRNPVIGEAGREFLSKELEQLSDAQIADLFRSARIERLHQTMKDGASGRREVTVDDWVKLFKQKRDEITQHRECGP